jgi:membrane protease YdiL (CAAX protease family)
MNAETSYSPTLAREKTQEQALRPLGWGASLALFSLPAVIVFFAFHLFRPWLESTGYNPFTSYLAALCVPLALLFAAALIAYHRMEGRPLTWVAFSERMRLPRLSWQDVFWGVAIFFVSGIGYGLISRLVLALIGAGWISLPAGLPGWVDPRAVITLETLAETAGGLIRGRWDIAALYLVTFFFNIAGEELWWRGYILPRQELAFGRRTWLVHGLLWAGFHAFKWWDVLSLLPFCLLISYSAQRTRSTWGALIGHALFNGANLVMILLVIAG